MTEMKNALGHPVSIDAGTEGTEVYVMGIPGTECNAKSYLQVCEKLEILKIPNISISKHHQNKILSNYLKYFKI